MKAIYLLLFCSTFIVACNEDKHFDFKLKEGIYIGNFAYQNKIYYSEIEIDSNTYIEWPSGGFIYQKPDECLSVGRFSILDNIISFKQDSFKYGIPQIECNPDMVLNSDFEIKVILNGDSVVFSRGRGSHSIYFHLKRVNN